MKHGGSKFRKLSQTHFETFAGLVICLLLFMLDRRVFSQFRGKRRDVKRVSKLDGIASR
jgi:hypothetical protein